jgi:SlyX protein
MHEGDGSARRLDALEIRVAYQDQTIDDLNAAITGQWKAIETLEREVAKLRDQLRALETDPGLSDQPEPPPPHY